jgi:hypothetical protein
MLCYRDMTFCTHYEDCDKPADCHRPLTETVRKAATEWWDGEGTPPIAVFGEKPSCHTTATVYRFVHHWIEGKAGVPEDLQQPNVVVGMERLSELMHDYDVQIIHHHEGGKAIFLDVPGGKHRQR